MVFRLMICLIGVMLLSGCLPDLFHEKAHYELKGVEADKPLRQEIENFLDERTAEPVPAKGSKSERQYIEESQAARLRAELSEFLNSKGYYDNAVNYEDGEKPWTGTYHVSGGSQYKIAAISVTPRQFKPLLKGLHPGQMLDAAQVLAAQKKLLSAIAAGKCYFTIEVGNEVTLDRKAKTARILFTVKAGRQAAFGGASFEGNKNVENAYLDKLPGWKKGDCFTRSRLDALRQDLFQSGLFSTAEIIVPEKLPRNGVVPVTVRVSERAPRTIRAGLSYYSDEGAGVTLGWKHRNFFGQAESLDTELKLSQIAQALTVTLTKPAFLRKDQTLAINASAGHEDTDGYTKTGIESGVFLSRKFGKRLSGSTGAKLAFNRVEDETTFDTNDFLLLSFPQSAVYDSRDNALDAKKGWMLNLDIEPFVEAIGENPVFLKTEFSARNYRSFGRNFTLAGRAKIGSILGPATGSLPATERFYAGGGGSVRGFGYQEVGPVKAGQPEGGRSLVEASAEARFKFNDTLGAVAFVDAGDVTNGLFPDFGDLSVGAGAGLRYYTGFGPLRFDVGVPLNKKETAASSYQIYISIGQSF